MNVRDMSNDSIYMGYQLAGDRQVKGIYFQEIQRRLIMMGFPLGEGMPDQTIVDLFGRNRDRTEFADPEPIEYTKKVHDMLTDEHFDDRDDLFKI
jgi:hypothetical protein